MFPNKKGTTPIKKVTIKKSSNSILDDKSDKIYNFYSQNLLGFVRLW
jgi:hypothetical protein